MTSITTITIRMWIQLPVCGNLGLILRPKKPSSQSTRSITMIVHIILFLLLSDLVKDLFEYHLVILPGGYLKWVLIGKKNRLAGIPSSHNPAEAPVYHSFSPPRPSIPITILTKNPFTLLRIAKLKVGAFFSNFVLIY